MFNCCVCVLFFFFKQKTAYDVRISDWSSDVCSSDLRHRARAVAACAIKTAQIAKAITGNAVHLHGGIGMTSEYTVGRYLLRALVNERLRSEEHTSELQSLMRISYAVFCLKKKKQKNTIRIDKKTKYI